MTRTAESVVLTPWPPGPEERNTSTRRSASSISGFVVQHRTALTAANEACRRLAWFYGEIRTSRWVPVSADTSP